MFHLLLYNVLHGWAPQIFLLAMGNGVPGPHTPNRALLGKLYKTKNEEHHQLCYGGSGLIRSSTSPWGPEAGPSARGGSAAMVPWPIEPHVLPTREQGHSDVLEPHRDP